MNVHFSDKLIEVQCTMCIVLFPFTGRRQKFTFGSLVQVWHVCGSAPQHERTVFPHMFPNLEYNLAGNAL